MSSWCCDKCEVVGNVWGFTCSINWYPFFWNPMYLSSKKCLYMTLFDCERLSAWFPSSNLSLVLFSLLSEYKTGSDVLSNRRCCFIMQGLIQEYLVIAFQLYCPSLPVGLVAWTDLVYKQVLVGFGWNSCCFWVVPIYELSKWCFEERITNWVFIARLFYWLQES